MAMMGASADLGAGDALQNQVDAALLERRKKLLAMQNQPLAAYGQLGMGTGVNTGQGNMGMAYQALMGQGGLGG